MSETAVSECEESSTAAHGEMARRRGGDRDSLPPTGFSGRMRAGSTGIPLRRGADGVRNDLKPPQKSLTEPRDDRILTSNAMGRSWVSAIWEMSDKGTLYWRFGDVDADQEVGRRVIEFK